jgi:cytochrome o ubiquinol oxidase subunit 2
MARTRWAFAFAAMALTACETSILNARGPVGRADATILIDSVAIMLAIVIPTIIATLGFAWWYRASNTRARHLPDWSFSGRIELVVWSIPIMVIILLGGVAWIGSHELDPAKPLASKSPPLDIQVVSLDWKWLFIYPDQHIATLNQLIVPAGVPLHFSLTSASVLNAFFIPDWGSMIYTMNGMTTQLNLSADEPGTFRGMSAHYSGDGFSDMHFEVRAVPAGEFTAWVETTRGNGQKLDSKSYVELEKQSINLPATSFSDVEPDLFKKIVMLSLPAGPGPPTEDSGAHQAPQAGQ